jgi:proteic killer suppression protein
VRSLSSITGICLPRTRCDETGRDRDAIRLFQRQPVRKLGTGVQRVALRKLRMLDAAMRLSDLRVPPGNRLERLRGDRTGQHSVRINDNGASAFDGARAMPTTWR